MDVTSRSDLEPRATRPRAASLAAFCLALAGACDSAYQGRSVSVSTGASLEFEFAGGTPHAIAVQGDAVELKVVVPDLGYTLLLDPGTLAIDPARLDLVADRDLGDPAQGGVAAGASFTQFAIAQGWTSVVTPPAAVHEIHVRMDTAVPLLFPAGLIHLFLTVTDDVGTR